MRDFSHTIGVLVTAYMNETLEHGNACGCAFGNMVAEANRIPIKKDCCGQVRWNLSTEPAWIRVLCNSGIRPKSTYADHIWNESIYEIETTGYTADEMQRIEFAFEMRNGNKPEEFKDMAPRHFDKDGFFGLMAVVDVLADIHGIDLKAKEEAKALFVKV